MDTISNLKLLKNMREKSRPRPRKHTPVTLYSPFLDRYYEYDRRKIKILPAPNKKSEIISFASANDLIIENMEINRLLEGQSAADAIEIKALSELSLEPSLEYKICSQKIRTNDDGYDEYDVYAIAVGALKQRTANIKSKYLDYVFAPQSVFRTLFKHGYLKPLPYVFIYLHADFAYLCVYQNGSLAYSKPLKASLENLTKRFCEISGDRIERGEFCSLLTNKSPKREGKEGELERVFAELFSQVSDILSHAKRVCRIEEFAAAYVGSEAGAIYDIAKSAAKFFDTPFLDLEFNLKIRCDEFVDMASKLMLFAYANDKKDYEELNLSIFSPPPPFFHRDSGIFLTVCAASLTLSLAPIIYNLTIANYVNNVRIGFIEKELKEPSSVVATLKADMKKASDEKAELTAKIAAEEQKQKEALETLNALKTQRGQNGLTSQKIALIANVANAKGVTLQSLSIVRPEQNQKTEDGVKINCKAKSAANITEFVKLYESLSGATIRLSSIRKENGLYTAQILGKEGQK